MTNRYQCFEVKHIIIYIQFTQSCTLILFITIKLCFDFKKKAGSKIRCAENMNQKSFLSFCKLILKKHTHIHT